MKACVVGYGAMGKIISEMLGPPGGSAAGRVPVAGTGDRYT